MSSTAKKLGNMAAAVIESKLAQRDPADDDDIVHRIAPQVTYGTLRSVVTRYRQEQAHVTG